MAIFNICTWASLGLCSCADIFLCRLLSTGYRTLTRFWSGQVGKLVRKGRFASRRAAVREAMQMFGEDRDRHRLFYSFDVVKDRRARREWVAPDRWPTNLFAS